MASNLRYLRLKHHLPANPTRLYISPLCRICLALLLLSGCSAVSGIVPPCAPVQSKPAGLQIGDVVETATGNVIGMNELAAKLCNASIVYVGEIHTNSEDHKAQLDILRRLSQGGQCVELGMEMFPVAAQPILDRYIRAEMTEDEFLSEVKWNEIWGFPYQLYRGLIDFQKDRCMPVLGLNAPIDVVRKIAHSGLGSLTPEQRSQVAREFHLDDPRNRLRVHKEYAVHGKASIKDFESFFEAQLAWEETMAQTLAERLEKTGAKCKILVAIGAGHISAGLGVPYLTFIRKPHEYRTIVPVPIDYPSTTLAPDLADYVVITDKSEPLHRPRLGVTIEPSASGRGVQVIEIIPGAPASAAGLLKGDIIVSIDGSPVKGAEDIQRILTRGGPHYQVIVERNMKQMAITVTIEP
jgi:uncharacterized iron-regulated protein